MRVRFLDDTTNNVTVVEIRAMEVDDTFKYGKCVIITPVLDCNDYFWYYCDDKKLIEFFDIASSQLLQNGWVDLCDYTFIWSDTLFDEDDNDIISLNKDKKKGEIDEN